MLTDILILVCSMLYLTIGNYISYHINDDFKIVDYIHILSDRYNGQSYFYILLKDLGVTIPLAWLFLTDINHGLTACKLYTVCSIFRPICYLSTSLPPPNTRFTKIITHPMQTLSGSKGDLIYSGHMTLVTSSLLVIEHFYNWSFLLWVYILFIGFLTSFTRSHYTVDVVISIIIVQLITSLLLNSNEHTFWNTLHQYVFINN